MKTIELNCFEITEPDGGGQYDVHVAYASTKEVADAIIKSLGSSWPRTANKFTKTFTVVESVEEYKNNTAAALRKSAASKLTAAERKLLKINAEGDHVLY